MTYSAFLAVFLCVPIGVMSVVWAGRIRKHHAWACLVVCALAFCYTSPWDNYAAKTGLWTFDRTFAPPSHFVVCLPWEEYTFYILQGVFVCLLTVGLSKYLRPNDGGAL